MIAPVKPRRSKGQSPTARSLALLRARGYVCEVVERRLPRCFITKDLFGFIDILAIKDGQVLAVQTTSGGSGGHVAARIHKIANSPLVGAVRDCGWSIHVHGWRKNAEGRWVCREEDVS